MKTRPTDPVALKSRLIERFATRERNDVGRVREVVQLAEHSGCVVRYLLHYFGEDLARNCGHCSNCLGVSRIRIINETKPPELDQAKFAALRRQHIEALTSPRQIARFLCGMSSPLLTQTKLNKHPDYGSLAEVPFRTVLEAAEQFAGVTPVSGRRSSG
jgi:ATP-dependent DNA helicase RecQ